MPSNRVGDDQEITELTLHAKRWQRKVTTVILSTVYSSNLALALHAIMQAFQKPRYAEKHKKKPFLDNMIP